jgi:hypothetical protein
MDLKDKDVWIINLPDMNIKKQINCSSDTIEIYYKLSNNLYIKSKANHGRM